MGLKAISADNTKPVAHATMTRIQPEKVAHPPTSVGMCTRPDSAIVTDPSQALKGVTIMLNPGHGVQKRGGFDSGVVAKDKTNEADLNEKVADQVETELKAMGATVIKIRDMKEKIQEQEDKVKPDLFLAIHHDEDKGHPKTRGRTFFVFDTKGASYKLAQKLEDAMNSAGTGDTKTYGTRDRGIDSKHGKNLRVLKADSSIPSVLIECGYVSNKSELQQLKDPAYQKQEADGIVKGIVNFFSERSKEKP